MVVRKKEKNSENKNRKKIKTGEGRSVFLGRISKVTGILLAVLLLIYFSVGFVLDKGFIKRDFNEKMGKVLGATTITLRIVGPPNKPVMTATPVCVNYVSYINLTWTSDDQMDFFDIERDGSPLVTGLVDPHYEDVLVDPLTSYSYTVTAFNIYGQTTSDPAVAVALDCGTSPPPPFLTATPTCVGSVPFVNLSWTTQPEFNSFDLFKNGNPLASIPVDTEYEDGAVAKLANYSYSVIGFTSEGYVASNSVDVSTLDCAEEPPPPPEQGPSCKITKFHNIILSGYQGTPTVVERRPSFFGNTNMANAIIEIKISGKTSIVATTSASSNGYWMWKPPDKLKYGSYKIKVVATDPADPTRTKTATLDFRIVEKEEEISQESMEEVIPALPAKEIHPTYSEIVLPEITAKVTNPDKIAYSGKDLLVETKIAVKGNKDPFDTKINYQIVDEDYKEVFQVTDQIRIDGDRTIEKNISIPQLLKPGKYKVLISIWRNDTMIVAEDSFTLKEVPLVSLGGGATITATQIMSNLFWVILWLLILLIIFLILLEIEYWISRRAIIQITGERLREKGLIRRKKVQ
jgi:hypothetical protein